MTIIMGPAVLQIINISSLFVPRESGCQPLLVIAAKLYTALMFYCFYLTMREYVFFEQLLRGHDGDKACPEFDESNERSSADRLSFAQSYVSNSSSLMQSF